MGLFDAFKKKIEPTEPSNESAPPATMGWRYVAYQRGSKFVYFTIEPMASGPDTVYAPTEEAWAEIAPTWAQSRYTPIINYLKSTPWHRNLEWRFSENSSATFSAPIAQPGSLESTQGGQWLENQRLFHPTSPMSHKEAHEMWHRLAERFALACEGKVTLFVSDIISNSVFHAVELPALKSNPKVQLEFK